MANPFEDPDASYRVLVNHEGQHSLWPATEPTPDGWTVAHDTDSRAACWYSWGLGSERRPGSHP